MKHTININKVKSCAMALAIAATGMASLTGCSDFLEVEPRNEITFEKFWDEKTDVENIIAGCYSGMEEYAVLSRMLVWGEFRSENVEWNGADDDDVNIKYILKESITPTNSYSTWGEFYNIINRCNTVLKYAPGVHEKDPSYLNSELNAHMAEVTAIRSLLYFYLVRAFKDVPYSDEPFIDDDQTLDLPVTPGPQIIDNLVKSLEAVRGNAYVQYSDNETFNATRVTRSFIDALLCELYLWQGNYDMCIQRGQDVIDAKRKYMIDEKKRLSASDIKDFYDYPLIPTRYSKESYGQAFTSLFAAGLSPESIFELGFVKGSGDSKISNGPISDFYGSSNDGGSTYDRQLAKVSDYVGNDYKSPSIFNNRYDIRAYENIRYKTTGDPEAVNKYIVSSAVNFGKRTDDNSFFNSRSSWGVLYNNQGKDKKYGSLNKSNFIIYRLSDVMLLMAEAHARMVVDNVPETDADKAHMHSAFELVDAVNRRSLMVEKMENDKILKETEPKYQVKSGMIDLVYEERERELMFEGKRYFDLVRRSYIDGNTDYLRKNVKLKNSDLASVIDNKLKIMDAIYWPVHVDELKANANLHQNSAYLGAQ